MIPPSPDEGDYQDREEGERGLHQKGKNIKLKYREFSLDAWYFEEKDAEFARQLISTIVPRFKA